MAWRRAASPPAGSVCNREAQRGDAGGQGRDQLLAGLDPPHPRLLRRRQQIAEQAQVFLPQHEDVQPLDDGLQAVGAPLVRLLQFAFQSAQAEVDAGDAGRQLLDVDLGVLFGAVPGSKVAGTLRVPSAEAVRPGRSGNSCGGSEVRGNSKTVRGNMAVMSCSGGAGRRGPSSGAIGPKAGLGFG